MSKWKPWIEGLSAARQPDHRDHHEDGVSRKDRSPPRVGVAYTDPRKRDRADDREHEDESRRDDREEDVE